MDDLPRISEAEMEVMKVLWKTAPLGSLEIVRQLDRRDWSDRTIKSLLSRLVKKGALAYAEEGNRYLYSPAIPQEGYLSQAGQRFADKVLDGKVFPVLVQFLSTTRLDKAEIAELRRLLDDQEEV